MEPIIIERTYNAPISKVWLAITDPELMKKWYFHVDGFKPEAGNEFQFFGTGSKGEKYLHCCKILEVIPENKLLHTWRYELLEGSSTVTFELFAEGDKTRLKLTHKGIETLAANGPDFLRESFEKGWTHLIGKSLREFVENN